MCTWLTGTLQGYDPTNGFVRYGSFAESFKKGLIHTKPGKIFMGVDHENVAPFGRDSVRIESKKLFGHGLFILELEHMPVGCGTWPAFWSYSDDGGWPNGGEIDIIEGVHNQEFNNMALHTGADCRISPVQHPFVHGTTMYTNCHTDAPGQPANVGCAVHDERPQSYGQAFNEGGGGVYAMERTSRHVSIWFFPRDEVPPDALVGVPQPDTWGAPAARFTNALCDLDKKMKPQKLIFNITFCGDWAGNVWESSGW